MEMFITFLIFVVALLSVIKGADWFTDAAIWFADHYKIPKVIIGATIVSLSTTMPEFIVSTYSSWVNQPEVAFGNAIGSVICNIGLILGVALLIRSYRTNHDLFMHKGMFMAAAATIFAALSLDGLITRNDGIVLIIVLCGYVYYSIQVTRATEIESVIADEIRSEKLEIKFRSIFKREYQMGYTLKFVLGAMLVIVGGRFMVDSGVSIAEFFGIPQSLIAVTLLAVGTSLPEFVTSITAALKGHLDLSIGNILGANILDLTWVMGISSLIRPIPVETVSINIDIPFMVVLSVLVIAFGRSRRRLEKWEGLLFLSLYLAYLVLRLRPGIL
jgi:cation:H+ antiporter